MLRETRKCPRRIYVFRFFVKDKVCGACMYFGRDLKFQPEITTLLRKSDKVDAVFIFF